MDFAAMANGESAVQVVDVFELTPVKVAFRVYGKQIGEMATFAEAHEVTDSATRADAVSMMGQVAKLNKRLEAEKLLITKDSRAYTSSVNGLVKVYTGLLPAIRSGLQKKVDDFAYKELVRDRAAAKLAQEAQVKAQAELDKAARKAKVETIILPPVITKGEGEKTVVRTESGSSYHTKFEWKGVVVEPDKVDRSLCSPDQKKLDEFVQAGGRKADGIEIKEVPVGRLRT